MIGSVSRACLRSSLGEDVDRLSHRIWLVLVFIVCRGREMFICTIHFRNNCTVLPINPSAFGRIKERIMTFELVRAKGWSAWTKIVALVSKEMIQSKRTSISHIYNSGTFFILSKTHESYLHIPYNQTRHNHRQHHRQRHTPHQALSSATPKRGKFYDHLTHWKSG